MGLADLKIPTVGLVMVLLIIGLPVIAQFLHPFLTQIQLFYLMCLFTVGSLGYVCLHIFYHH